MRMKVICYIDAPTPIAYQDVYEEGDEWVKIKGCVECPVQTRLRCCGNHDPAHVSCPVQNRVTGECNWHLMKNPDKPFNCIIKPLSNAAMSFCVAEYRCVKGSNIGKIRRICDPANVLIES